MPISRRRFLTTSFTATAKQLGFLLVIILAWAGTGCRARAQDHSRRILMDDYFGVNVSGCAADPHDVKKVAAWIRDYSQWRWLEPEKDQYRFTNASGYMNYDAWYRGLDSQGIKSLFVVQQTPKWARGKDSSFAPGSGQDGLHPNQYTDAASFFYQLAARYGRHKTEAAYLRTPDKLSGLHLMNAIGGRRSRPEVDDLSHVVEGFGAIESSGLIGRRRWF